MSKMKDNFKTLEELLPPQIKPLIRQKLMERDIVHALAGLISGNVKSHVKPMYMKGKDIYCAVDNPIWGNEFLHYKTFFIGKLKQQFPREEIADIRVKFQPGAFKKETEEKIILTEDEERLVSDTVADIGEKELKDSFANLMKTLIAVDKNK